MPNDQSSSDTEGIGAMERHGRPAVGPTSPPEPEAEEERRAFRALRWRVMLAVAVVALVFDWAVDTSLGLSGGGHAVLLLAVAAEVLVMGAGVWLLLVRWERGMAERHRAAEALYRSAREREEELTAVYEASLAVSDKRRYPDVLQVIVDVAKDLVGARFGALAEFDAAERVVSFVTSGVDPEVRELIGLPPTHEGLLKRLSGERRPLRIEDIGREPDMTGFPEHHPDIAGFIGAAIRSGDDLLGHLYLGGPSKALFTERDARVLGLFAQLAAVVVGRARMERQRRRMLRVEEKRRLAAELHDGALQALYAVGIQMARARRRGLTELTDTMTTSDALGAIERAMTAIRGELEALDGDLDRTPWEHVVRTVDEVASLYGVAVTWRGSAPDLAEAEGEALAQAFGELVSNAVRHGMATAVSIRTDSGPNGCVFRLADDGRGFPEDAPVTDGEGLRSVRRRLGAVGAELRLRSTPEGVSARITLPPAAPDGAKGGGD